MPKSSVVGLICLLLVAVVAGADDSPNSNTGPIQLIYAPEAGSSISYELEAELQNVTLQGSPTGIIGEGTVAVAVEFAESAQQEQERQVTVTLTDITGCLNGGQHNLAGTQAVALTLGEQAQPLRFRIEQSVASNDWSVGADALTGLAVLSGFAQLPAQPVEIGQQWQWKYTVRHDSGTEPTTVNMHSRVVSCSDEQVIIESNGRATLPPRQIPNPMQPGQQMRATNAQVTLTKLRQICERQTMVVVSVIGEGTLKFDGVMLDYTLPLAMDISFKLTPAAGAATP